MEMPNKTKGFIVLGKLAVYDMIPKIDYAEIQRKKKWRH
jgi:hypothetical protein